LIDKDCTTVSIGRPDSAGNAILLFGGASQSRFTRLWESSLDHLEHKREIAPSSRASYFPRFSPDGTAIAFVSERSGRPEVWRAAADGSDPVRLTTDSVVESEPNWSHDGRQLVFTSGHSKPSGLSIVSVEGGAVTPVNIGGQYSNYGSWSRNSGLLYFSTPTHIWQVRPDGSDRRKVYEGTFLYLAAESPDGRFVYWNDYGSGLYRVSLASGLREQVHGLLAIPRTSVAGKSIYFVSNHDRALYKLSLDGGAVTRIGVLPAFARDVTLKLTIFGFTVSPDEKRIVWAEQDPQIDLEMIREFR
jgi:hypothetical protein